MLLAANDLLFFCLGTKQPWFTQQFQLFHFKHLPFSCLHLLLQYPSFSFSSQPWLLKPARESHPPLPQFLTSRVPLGLRVSLVPSTSVLPPVSVLQKLKMSRRVYRSPREQRKCSTIMKNARVLILILIYVDGRTMYVGHQLNLWITAKNTKVRSRLYYKGTI